MKANKKTKRVITKAEIARVISSFVRNNSIELNFTEDAEYIVNEVYKDINRKGDMLECPICSRISCKCD